MHELVALIAQYGLPVVFANVLAERLGAPIPAIPVLIVAGALAVDGGLSASAVFAVALAAAMLGDIIWYAAGRRFGYRVLKTLCRIAINPDSCVRQTETFFERWGAGSLVVAKFIPGFSTVAPPLAGAMGLSWGRFLWFNAIGAAIWIAAGLGAGWLFHRQVDHLLLNLEAMGTWALMFVAALFVLLIAIKWWERQKLFKMLRMARISVEDLHRLMDEGHEPVIVDVRSSTAKSVDGRYIPGAIKIEMADLDHRLGDLPKDRELILYCNCPNEASAANVASVLMKRGFKRVRPLEGGLDAWVAAGLDVEEAAGNAEA